MHAKQRSRIFLCSVLLLALAHGATAQPVGEKMRPRQTYINTYNLLLHSVVVGGVEFTKADVPDAALSDEMLQRSERGQVAPFVPIKYVYIGLPTGASLSVTAKSLSGETKKNILLAPFVSGDSSAFSSEEAARAVQSAAYKSAEVYPSALARVARYFFVGSQYVAQVVVSPLQYNAARRELQWHRLIELTWDVVASSSSPTLAPNIIASALDETFLKQHLVNYDDAKKQHGATSFYSVGATANDSTGAWYDASQPYLKFYTTEDGVYRVSGSDLASIGASLSGINPRTFRLLHNGREIPIRVLGEADGRFDPNDEIEFIGSLNRGTPEPVLDEFSGNLVATVTERRNVYSDTSVYWLTWGGQIGRRVPSVSAAPRGGSLVDGFPLTVRLEQDCVYVTGLTESAQYVTERALGEGWAQRILQANASLPIDTARVSFRLEGVRGSGSVQAQLRFAHTTSGAGELEILINSTSIGVIPFTGRGARTYTLSFNASVLQNGANQLIYRLRRSNAQTSVAIAIPDWIELTFQRNFSMPSTGLRELFFSSSAAQDIRVSGSRDSDYTLYDLSDTTHLVNAVADESGVRFSVEPNKRYGFIERQAIRRPLIRVHRAAPPLRSRAFGADYIIIAHPLFRVQANRLAAHRASVAGGGYRTIVVETEQIYDEFNFGMYNPLALKRFLRYAFENWQPPRARFVVLFGGANRDFKGIERTSMQRPPLVPTYGQPVSDVWLTSFDNAPSRPYRNIPRMMIGRIPVYTTVEADVYLRKLIGDGQPFRAQAWQKNFIFINGGFNQFEQQLFRAYSNGLISSFVTPAPIAARADTLYRDDQNPFISNQLEEQIQNTLVRGGALVHYIGHAGSNSWDLALGDPLTLRNDGRYPLVLSWTCNTGRFAEPFGKSFAESFIVSPNGGATCFIGTSGWGFPSLDNIMSQLVFRAIRDTLRTAGEIWFSAHRAFAEQFNFYSSASEGTLDHYNIAGDPAERLPLATQPDLALEPDNIVFLNQTLNESAPQPLSILIGNYGLATRDSVNVRVYDRWSGNSTPLLVVDTTLRPIGLRDSIVVRLDFTGRLGLHDIDVQLDERNRITETSESNNRASLRVNVQANTVAVAAPPFSVASQRQPTFMVLNDSERPEQERFYQFELDTTDQFNSPLRLSSPNIREGLYTTDWRPTASLIPNTPYFWRVRSMDGAKETPWQVVPTSFSESTQLPNGETWRQAGTHLHRNRLNGLSTTLDGITNGDGRLPMTVRSVGLNGERGTGIFYEITVGDNRQFAVSRFGSPTTDPVRGLNVVVLDTSRGVRISRVENFDFISMFPYTLTMPDTSLPRRFNQLIDGMTQNQIALISLGDAIPDTRDLPMTPIRQRLEQLGSRHFGNLRYRESWAFIGSKNRQVYAEAWGTRCNRTQQIGCDSTREATTIDTAIIIQRLSAEMTTEPIGAASRWRTLSWQSSETAAQTRISIFGVRLDGREDSLLSTTQFAGTDLSNINARRYPFLKLRATLSRSQTTGLAPTLREIQLVYMLAGDAALAHQTFRAERDTIDAGEMIRLSAEARNLGASRLDSIVVRLSRIESNGQRQVLQTIQIDSLVPAQSRQVSFSVASANRIGRQTFALELDPNNQLAELSKQNNRTTLAVFVRADTVRPTATIEFDGRRISNGETVRQRPRIVIRAYDNTLSLLDTNSIRVSLNRRPIFYSQETLLTFTPAMVGSAAQTVFTPVLTDGDYTLVVTVRDGAGNVADSASVSVRFTVDSKFKVESLFNYPNPFSDKTEFAFRLTSADNERPTEFKIFIYTLAGRLIQEIDAMPVINASWSEYYRVPWDGRDKDGDALANGVYLYRAVIRSPRGTITKSERLAIVR